MREGWLSGRAIFLHLGFLFLRPVCGLAIWRRRPETLVAPRAQ